MTDIIVDKLVEHNKIVGADVFSSEKIEAMMFDPEFKKIESEMGPI